MTTILPRSRQNKLWRMRAARGEVFRVDPTRARNHIHHLLGLGLTNQMIADAAGCSREGLVAIRDNRNRQLDADLERRILAVTFRSHPAQKLALAIGMVRRVQALNAIGWPVFEIAAHAGLNESHLYVALRRNYVTRATWVAIDNTYRQLSGTPGPSPIARRRALNANWPPPIEWELHDIDDPTATPDWKAPRRTPTATTRAVLAGVTTHCRHGHRFTTDNPGYRADGVRHCKTCSANATRRYRQRKAAH
ncbi:hypothetical protein [Nocardia sp. NPDC051833]|uniref:hypothetical protein n=1 Tax=Nocardia sp. NPDC051833 TaxID=3155674 RepID=UPI00344A2218